MTILFDEPAILLWTLGVILFGYFGTKFLARPLPGLRPERQAAAKARIAILLALAGVVGLFVTGILFFFGGADIAFLITIGLISASLGVSSQS